MTPDDLDNLFKAAEPGSMPESRLKQIESAVTRDLAPVRPLGSKGFYIAALAGIFLVVWILGCMLMGLAGWRALSSFQKVSVFVPLGVTVGLAILTVTSAMFPGEKFMRNIGIISVCSFILLLVMMVLIFQPFSETAFIRNGLTCFKIGMAFSIPAAILFAPLLIRGAGLSPGLAGAAAGGLAGLVGLGVLEIQCPNLNVYHIVVWHVSVTLVCVVAGWIFSGVTFRRRWANNQPSGG
jgi:hypothetical protein